MKSKATKAVPAQATTAVAPVVKAKAVKAKSVPAQTITAVVPVQAVAPVVTKAKADKQKRVSLNPQPILDRKTEALAAKGVKLTWSARAWHAGDKTFSSLEMSKYSVDDFAALFPGK